MFTYIRLNLSNSESWRSKLEEVGFSSQAYTRSLEVSVAPKDFKPQEELIRELAHKAVQEFQA